jgi:nitronate monooxygenase
MNSKVKDELVVRQEFDTVLYGKTIELQGRAMKNEVIKNILEMESRHAKLEEIAPFLMGLRQTAIWDDGDIQAGLLPVGQSIGLIHNVVSCKELVEGMVKQAEELLNKAQKRFHNA